MRKQITGLGVVIAIVLTATLTACSSPKAKVPDLSGSDLASAKTLLTNLGFVPTVEEIYSDSVDTDLVVRTKPQSGSEVDPNSKVTVIISKGPKTVQSSDSQLSWTYVSYGEDKWEFENPYIEEGKLHVKFNPVKFMASVKWKDNQNNGYGFGLASITDTFDKSIPLQINWDRQYSSYGQAQSFEVVVPVTDLQVQKPTNLYMKLYAYVDGVDTSISADLSITW